MRTITVTGKGMIKIKPDTTRLIITLEGTNAEYGKALEQAASDTNQLKDMLAEFGFERDELKTINFNAEAEFESYKEKQNSREIYKKQLIGYRFRQISKIEFESDNDKLGRILYALSVSSIRPEFRISYTVKDPESAKNELLGNAIKDAKTKAAVLTSASEVKLKDIQSIDYSWGEMDFEVRPMRTIAFNEISMSPRGVDSFDIDIEPDDIEISDTVRVVWEIE